MPQLKPKKVNSDKIKFINLEIKFINLQQELVQSMEKLTSAKTKPFIEIKDLADKALQWMELDIYLPTMFSEKADLLQRISAVINDYCAKHSMSIKNSAALLTLLSKDNLTFYYDKGWLYHEKHRYFEDTVKVLTQQLQDKLAVVHQPLSTQIIANCMFALSVWYFQPDTVLVDLLIKTMERAVQQEKPISPSVAFCFLKGATRLIQDRSFPVDNPRGAELFAILAESALPLLLQDEPPLEMFPVRNLMLSMISTLLILLPQPKYEEYQRLFFDTTMRLLERYGSIGNEEIYRALPDEVVPHKLLLLALENRQAELFETEEMEKSPSKDQPQLNVYHKDIGKVYFSLEKYQTFLKLLHKAENPKGLQWTLTRYSEAITRGLEKGDTTYPLAEIKDYLKLLRHCLLDASVPAIQKAIVLLGKEALSDVHVKKIDFALAIDLLWINLVLSTTLNDQTIAYSSQEQASLFGKIQNHKVNADQARALFAIKTLKWHGGLAFKPRLLKQMQTHAALFAKGANPSQAEKDWYEKIRAVLPKEQQNFLQANYICNETGQEIDIAFIGDKKIAIHVDGPSHFNPVTGQRTMHTLFRDHCLAGAGWTSFSINLIDGQEDVAKLAVLQNELAKDVARSPVVQPAFQATSQLPHFFSGTPSSRKPATSAKQPIIPKLKQQKRSHLTRVEASTVSKLQEEKAGELDTAQQQTMSYGS